MAPGSYYKNSGSWGHCGAPPAKKTGIWDGDLGCQRIMNVAPCFTQTAGKGSFTLLAPRLESESHCILAVSFFFLFCKNFLKNINNVFCVAREGRRTNVSVFAGVESRLTVDIQLIGILCGTFNPICPNASTERSLLGARSAYKACERAAETRLRGVHSFRTSAY